jgi:hypothetical protein
MHLNELGQKVTTQKTFLLTTKDPPNGGLDNKQIALRGVVTKEKKVFGNIKGMNKRYALR